MAYTTTLSPRARGKGQLSSTFQQSQSPGLSTLMLLPPNTEDSEPDDATDARLHVFKSFANGEKAPSLRRSPRRLRAASPQGRAENHSNTPPSSSIPSASRSSLVSSSSLWLCLYFIFNLSLTLYNKSVLVHFPFPYTLTAIHCLCGTLGGWLLERKGWFARKELSKREEMILALFSVLYAVNIVVSNASLRIVTVPFHQVVRAASPVFTIAISTFLYGQTTSRDKLISLAPVVFGVCLATYGDYYFTSWGLALTLLGAVLASLKTIYTHKLQTATASKHSPAPHTPHLPSSTSSSSLSDSSSPPPRRKVHSTQGIHPLELLTRMSPLAFIQCVLYAHFSGELGRVSQYTSVEMSRTSLLLLMLNGIIAFGLNVVSFVANGKVGAVGISVAANVKQVLTILFAVSLFDLRISGFNALGIVLTLVGGGWYAWVEVREKRQNRKRCDT